jgi:hypothetical protein
MITELVFFDLPKGTTRTRALEMYRQTAGTWLANPDLVQKYYFFDEARSVGGGVYVWPSRAEAEKWHGDAYKKKVFSIYGSPPRIEILDALIHVDPRHRHIEEL